MRLTNTALFAMIGAAITLGSTPTVFAPDLAPAPGPSASLVLQDGVRTDEMREKGSEDPRLGGMFVGVEGHRASGGFMFAREGERLQLRFDDELRVQRGPDVYVVLSTSTRPSRDRDLYLMKIKSFRGEQTYDLPANIDLTKYRYVLLWCERFSVGIGQGLIASE